MSHSLAHHPGARRALGCALSVMLGLAAAAVLLLLARQPALAAGTVRPYPGLTPCDTSLQACVDGALPGDTIVITAGTYITSLTLSQAVSLTGIASNTVILHALPGQRVLTVTSGLVDSSVVISGLTFTGGDVSGAGGYPANCGGGIYLDITTEPQFVNVIITGNVGASGGGLCALNSATLHLKDSQVLSNTAASGDGGGGARVIDAADISGGRFEGNQCLGSSCRGGGLLTFFNSLAITGTQFFSNIAQNAGGAIYAYGPLTLTGGLLQHNQCADTNGCDGGALYAYGGLSLSGTQFISNSAHHDGGALFTNAASQLINAVFQDNACIDSSSCYGGGLVSVFDITLTNASFLSNTALSRGGGAFASGSAVFNGGLFQNNTCTQNDCHGGALLTNASLVLTNTQFLTNSDGGEGGALEAVGVTTMSNGLFRGNRCTQPGCQAGALRAGGVTLNGTQFFHNQSSGGGGAATVDSAAISAALFQDNSCDQLTCRGGALLGATSVTLTNTQFLSNTASQWGGGAFINNDAHVSSGKFQGNQCTAADCDGGGLYTSGTLALSGTQFIGNLAHKHGGGAYAFGAASLSGGLFQGNQCFQADCQGGGLSVFNGIPLTLTNMTFLSNTALVQGGGVNALGSAAISGGLFQGNRCTQISCTAGGLYVAGTLALSGTQVINNQSRLDGAGVLANGGGALTNGLFQNNACNQANCHGGGISAGGALTVTNTQFLNNASFSHGGGVYVGAAANVSVSGGQFQGNQCTQTNCTGGGLYEVGGLTLTSADFVGNNARSHGGGVYAAGAAVITNGLFQDNHCSQDNCEGGGLHGQNNLTLSGTQFISNSARFSAGGVYVNASALAVLNGGLFQGNICSQTGCRGGGINVNGSIALTGTRFVGNAAVFDGGGLRTAGPATVVRAVFKGNSAFEGGGFYHAGGAGSVVNTLFVSNQAAGGGEAVYVNGSGGAFNLLHDTIGVPLGVQPQPAVQVAAGSVGITNTLIFYHDTGIARTGGTLYEDYNLFAQVGISVTGGAGGGTHSHLDPNVDLINPTGGDFHLSPGSHAIDAGVNAGIFVDFEGQPRPLGNGFDIGYDEALVRRLYLPLLSRH